MNDLPIAPKDFEMPQIPRRIRGTRKSNNFVSIPKSDFVYMAEQKFCGWFAIRNCARNREFLSVRLMRMLEDGARTIRLRIVNSKMDLKLPDGATWHTVMLVSAYKDASGKRVAIHIEPCAADGKECAK